MIYRLIHNLKFWYLLGLAHLVLWQLTLGGSRPHELVESLLFPGDGPYGFIEPLLYLIFFLGLWLDSHYHFRDRLTFSRGKAVFFYFVIFLTTATVYEVSLSSALGLFSNYHLKPIPGFTIIIGLYLAFSIVNFFLIRRYHYTFKELYFAAGPASLWEGLVFTGVLTDVILSPGFFLAPLTFAYYMLIYGIIFCMPFVFIREELLWSRAGITISFWRKMLYSFIASFVALLAWWGWETVANVLTGGFEKF